MCARRVIVNWSLCKKKVRKYFIVEEKSVKKIEKIDSQLLTNEPWLYWGYFTNTLTLHSHYHDSPHLHSKDALLYHFGGKFSFPFSLSFHNLSSNTNTRKNCIHLFRIVAQKTSLWRHFPSTGGLWDGTLRHIWKYSRRTFSMTIWSDIEGNLSRHDNNKKKLKCCTWKKRFTLRILIFLLIHNIPCWFHVVSFVRHTPEHNICFHETGKRVGYKQPSFNFSNVLEPS